MLPLVKVAHSVAGRTRLRADPALQSSDFYTQVVRRLAKLSGVEELSANPRTGSIVVRHHVPLASVVRYARDQGLFETSGAQVLPETHPTSPPPPQRLVPLSPFETMTLVETVSLDGTAQRAARAAPTAETREAVVGLGAVALLGAGVFQLLRGDVLPAALPLILQAMQVLRRHGPPLSFPQ